jgi:hypothetical protein
MILGVVVMALMSARGTRAVQTPQTTLAVPAANASVADIKGNVQVQMPGKEPSPASLGEVLPPETTITTRNGRILLRLEDGSQILVQSNTNIVLKQPSPTNWERLRLLLGKIRAEIQKRTGEAPPFQIGTPSAVITVRGTRFSVRVDKHKATRVDVEEGVVEVENLKGVGKPVRVKAGFSSTVKQDAAPDEPKAVPGSERQSGNGRDNGPTNQRANPPGGRGRRP